MQIRRPSEPKSAFSSKSKVKSTPEGQSVGTGTSKTVTKQLS